MARKNTNPVQKSYRKERQRIQRQVKRMLARGYTIGISIPEIPKKITEASVRRLQKITTEKIYKTSDYTYTENGVDKMVSGLQGRKMERKQAIRLAVKTRKARRKVKELAKQNQQDWERQQRERDAENIERLEDDSYREQFSAVTMAQNKIYELLAEKEAKFPRTVQNIRNVFSEVGTDIATNRLLEAGYDIEVIVQILYKAIKGEGGSEYNELLRVINGRALSAEEIQRNEDLLEQDLAENFDAEELF